MTPITAPSDALPASFLMPSDARDDADAAVASLTLTMTRTGERASQLLDRATTVLCLTSVVGTQLGGVNDRASSVADCAGDIAVRSDAAAAAVVEIRTLVDEARLAVESLSTTARDIEQISATLRRMALETRMVGLNAAIEAARAGAAGAGFAVVAEKVRELADGAHTASEQIVVRLTAVRDSAVRSVAVMDRVGTGVGAIDAHARDIARAAADPANGASEIASAVAAASASVEEIVRHVEDVTETGMALSDGAAAGREALARLQPASADDAPVRFGQRTSA